MVGTTGFEPTTSSTPRKRATKLRYVPNISYVTTFPIFIVLVILSLCDDVFQGSSLVYRLSIGMTLPFSIMDGLQAAELPLPGVHDFLMAYLPLYSVNLGWLLPALAGAIVGILWNQMHKSHQPA